MIFPVLRSPAAWVLVAVLATVAPRFAAADRAKKLAEQGKQLADSGDLVGAISRFRAAAAIDDSPIYRCNTGNAFSRLLDWMRTYAFLAECLAARDQLADQAWAAELDKVRGFAAGKLEAGGKHGRVTIAASPPGAALAIPAVFDPADRFARATELWLPAGEHTLVFSLDGHDPAERTVQVKVGEVSAVEIALTKTAVPDPKPPDDKPKVEPPPPDPDPTPPIAGPEVPRDDPPSRAPAVALFAGAGVALTGAVVFHVLAVNTRNELKGMVAGPDRDELVDELERERLIMFALYGTAAVATAVGTVLWLRARPEDDGEPRVGLSVGPRRLGAWVRF